MQFDQLINERMIKFIGNEFRLGNIAYLNNYNKLQRNSMVLLMGNTISTNIQPAIVYLPQSINK